MSSRQVWNFDNSSYRRNIEGLNRGHVQGQARSPVAPAPPGTLEWRNEPLMMLMKLLQVAGNISIIGTPFLQHEFKT